MPWVRWIVYPIFNNTGPVAAELTTVLMPATLIMVPILNGNEARLFFNIATANPVNECGITILNKKKPKKGYKDFTETGKY
jgi:hypothetical protein